jgi:hypothetical protein
MKTNQLQILVRPYVRSFAFLLFLFALLPAQAGNIYVPNYSFETPSVPDVAPYADPYIDYWQETPQPAYYDPAQFNNTPWQYLVGEFYNDPADGAYIVNANGSQCAFLQSLPGVGLFQDYTSVSDTQTNPSYAFNATYNPGHPYYLTASLIGGGGSMPPGATLQMIMYYRDASSNMVPVASRTITNSTTIFSNNTTFVDFQLDVPTVQTTDAWAGKKIGIEFLCTVGFTNYGGYWDLDNVRLVEGLNVPNFSFETPSVPDVSPYASPYLDYWQETPQPDYYNPAEFDNTPWQYLVGAFYNDTNDGAYILNADGVQCAFLQSLPEVGISQDYTSFSSTQSGPTYAFNSTYRVGKGYNLAYSLIGGGGAMPTNATLLVNLYYRDAASNMISVASQTITNSPTLFPDNTHFVPFKLKVPPVQPNDPWAGKNIGIEFLCTVDFSDYGGYWDVDNVKLSETVGAALTNPAVNNGQFSATLISEPGVAFNILTTTNLQSTNWTTLETVTNNSGSIVLTDSPTNTTQTFYRPNPL